MTVKSLSSMDKMYIIDAFLAKTKTLNELALIYSRSRRTIIRAIEEHGFDPGVKHRVPKAPSVDVYLDLSLQLPESPPVVEAKPWYRKVLSYVGIHA